MMWTNVAEQSRPQTTIWRMRIACRITKAIHTHTVYNTYDFQGNNDYANATQRYVILTLPVL